MGVGKVTQGHTDNVLPLAQRRGGTLLGRVRMVCAGEGAHAETLADLLCTQLLPVGGRTWRLGGVRRGRGVRMSSCVSQGAVMDQGGPPPWL